MMLFNNVHGISFLGRFFFFFVTWLYTRYRTTCLAPQWFSLNALGIIDKLLGVIARASDEMPRATTVFFLFFASIGKL